MVSETRNETEPCVEHLVSVKAREISGRVSPAVRALGSTGMHALSRLQRSMASRASSSQQTARSHAHIRFWLGDLPGPVAGCPSAWRCPENAMTNPGCFQREQERKDHNREQAKTALGERANDSLMTDQ